MLTRNSSRIDFRMTHGSSFLPREVIVLAAVAVLLVLLLLTPLAASDSSANLLAWNAGLPNGGWRPWAPRDEIAPEMKVDGPRLLMSGRGLAYVSGAWVRELDGINAGDVFDFRVVARTSPDSNVLECVMPRIVWIGRFGPDVTPVYATHFGKTADGVWEISEQVKAPQGVSGVRVELHLRWVPDATVSFEDASLTHGVEKPHRKVRVAAIYWRPESAATVETNVASFMALVDRAGQKGSDVILLSEHFKTVGVGTDAARFAEKVPGGPLFAAMSEKAKEYNTYIIYGDFVREKPFVSNAAVIVDRRGALAAIYRKVQLTADESVDRRPGDEVPTFDLDFGKVGVLICHDTTFPELPRILAVKGAEIVFVPIWGGDMDTMRTRAKENAYWWVTAGFDVASMVIDPTGNVRASTWKDRGDGVAWFEADLDEKFPVDWLGEWKNAVWKQRRPKLYGPLTDEPR